MNGDEYFHQEIFCGFRREVRLAHTVDEMCTFNQIDDHIITLIKHSHHPNMKKAKEMIEKIEFRGTITFDNLSSQSSVLIQKFIDTSVIHTSSFRRISKKYVKSKENPYENRLIILGRL